MIPGIVTNAGQRRGGAGLIYKAGFIALQKLNARRLIARRTVP